MTHWYGWALLGYVMWSMLADSWRLVRTAWRGPVTGREPRQNWFPLWVAVWATLAIAMVLA